MTNVTTRSTIHYYTSHKFHPRDLFGTKRCVRPKVVVTVVLVSSYLRALLINALHNYVFIHSKIIRFYAYGPEKERRERRVEMGALRDRGGMPFHISSVVVCRRCLLLLLCAMC